MKANEIKVGSTYIAKVNNQLTTVRVNEISERALPGGKTGHLYKVTNIKTGRQITFRSPSKFRGENHEGN